jgi:hypothetical protein
MAENIPVAAVNQVAQIGAEAEFGTEVAATIRLMGVTVKETPKITGETFKASGAKGASLVLYGLENGALAIDGKATFEEIGYFCTSIPKAAATDIPSYTYEVGQVGGNGNTYPGGIVKQWTLKCDNKGATISAQVESASRNANALTGGITGTVPTPIQAGGDTSDPDIAVLFDAVEITNWFELTAEMQNLWEGVQFGGTNEFGGANEGDFKGTFSIKLEADAANRAYIEAANRDVMLLTLTMKNATDTVVVRFNIKLEDVKDLSAAGQVYGIDLQFTVMDVEVASTGNIVDVAIS